MSLLAMLRSEFVFESLHTAHRDISGKGSNLT